MVNTHSIPFRQPAVNVCPSLDVEMSTRLISRVEWIARASRTQAFSSKCRESKSTLPRMSQVRRDTRAFGTSHPRFQTQTPSPKKPSPYRLLSPQSFVADFAPLHVHGWRLDHLSAPRLPEQRPHPPADLQDRRLVRSYRFEATKDGWRDLMRLATNIGEHAEAEDVSKYDRMMPHSPRLTTRHHPSILISPAQDYSPTSPDLEAGGAGYVLEVATHTHTPLPPGGMTKGPKMRPGVTTKDIRLASKIEESYGP